MSVEITGRLFFNDGTGTSGGGVVYYPGSITSRIFMRMGFGISWNLTAARLSFDSATKTIRMLNPYDSRRFTTQGFVAGDNITVVDSASNNGNLTVASVADDGLSMVTVEALTDERTEGVSVHGVTPITSIDYLYNLIANAAQETYISSIDEASIQKFTADGLDASDTVTVVNMRVATKSLAWVFNDIVNDATYETDEVLIKGMGIVDYVQLFRIDQYLTTPFWTVAQYYNYYNDVAPAEWSRGSSLKHICSIGAKFESDSPSADHTGGVTSPNGTGSWYDRGLLDRKPEYSSGGITYQDVVSPYDSLDTLDVGKSIVVTMTLTSTSGLFVENGSGPPGTKVIVKFFACASDSADYRNESKTARQNFLLDTATAVCGGAVVDGDNFGTDYQVITDVEAAFGSTTSMEIAFVFAPGSALIDYWESKTDGDRYFAIVVETEDITNTTTKESDVVEVRFDFNTADWDKTDSSLFEFTGSGLYAYEYPNASTLGVGSIEGFAGDPWVVSVPFRVDNQVTDLLSPTIKKIQFQVVAKKTGKDDFIIEEQTIDCTGMKKLLDVQQVLVDQTRGFTTYAADPFNAVTIERDAANDTATQAAYVAKYGVVLRYEDWISATVQPGNRDDGTTPDIALDIEELTQRWADYSGVEGWDLAFRFRINIEGIDGNDNAFYCDMEMSVIGDDSSTWPGGSGALTQSLQYFEYDSTGAGINGGWAGEEIKCLATETQTLVRVTFTGDWTLPVTATGWYGWLSANLPQGSIFDRRFASSEIDSEDDTPWSDPGVDPLADISYANGSIRINVYASSKITLEGLLDTTMWGEAASELVVLQRLGAKYIST